MMQYFSTQNQLLLQWFDATMSEDSICLIAGGTFMKKTNKNKKTWLIGIPVILLVVVIVALCISPKQPTQDPVNSSDIIESSTETTAATEAAASSESSVQETAASETQATTEATVETTTETAAETTTETAQESEETPSIGTVLDKGLVIDEIGSFTGIYMEDGTDEMVSRILMIVVTNTSDRTIQYAELQLTDGVDTAKFALSTLPPGESMVVLEQNRMPYSDGVNLTQASAHNVAFFLEEPSTNEDKLKIQILDGIMNITNISNAPITGNVVVYYKNIFNDRLYGGITYRVTISGGLKTGEIKQISAAHFSSTDSRLMFTTIE